MTVSTIASTLPVVTPTVVFSDNGGTNIIGQSLDRTTLYGTVGTLGVLKTSTDDGVTWTTRQTIASTYQLTSARETGDGEILVTVLGTGVAARIFRSSGWVTNQGTATFALVLTSSGVNVTPAAAYGGVSIAGSTVLVTEYGLHTQEAATTNQAAIRAYLSLDNGATFAEVFNLLTTVIDGSVRGSTTNSHLHGGCVDARWNRLWLTYGDGGSSGKCGIVYSDDAGATWHLVPLSEDSTGGIRQCTTIHAMKDQIIFGPDGSPAAMYRIGRSGYRVMTALDIGHWFGGAGSYIGKQIHQPRGLDFPALICVTGTADATAGNGLSRLVASDGKRFWEVFVDNTAMLGYGGVDCAFLTASGKIVGDSSDSRQSNKSRFVIADATTILLP